MQLNKDTISKDIMVSPLVRVSDLMSSTNVLEFFTRNLVLPTTRASRSARNLDK